MKRNIKKLICLLILDQKFSDFIVLLMYLINYLELLQTINNCLMLNWDKVAS